MEISDKGLQLLSEWEGDIPHMYRDSAGLMTIGVGHLITGIEKASGYLVINGEHVPWASPITEEQSLALLHQDLKRFVAAVNNGVKVALNQDQFDALVIFSFNIGDSGFLSSTALRKVNANEFDQVPDAMRMWNKAGGVVNQGLVERREREVKLWLSRC